MPTRTYDSSALLNILKSATSSDGSSWSGGSVTPGNAAYTGGTGFNLSWSYNKSSSGIASPPATYTCAGGSSGSAFGAGLSGDGHLLATAQIDFTQFPTIPNTAIITAARIVCHVSAVNISTGSVVAPRPGTGNGNVNTNILFYSRLLKAQFGAFWFVGDFATCSNVANPGGSDTEIIDEVETLNLLTKVLTLTQFTAQYENINFDIQFIARTFFTAEGGFGGGNSGSASFDYTGNISNWNLEVDYDLEHYSWWIKPTQKIVNGQPVNIIEDPDSDIILVPDSGSPPDVDEGEQPYVRYGSSEDFPSGPTYYWWSSVDFYLFFIFSPISPDAGIITSWVNVGISPPTCDSCMTMTLESNTVLVADASGVYTLTAGKRNDTLYVRDTTTVEEVDFKINNPFAKIGFVP